MRKVILSKRAATKLDKLFLYLETEWSLKVKEEFVIKLDKSVRKIQMYPESCPEVNLEKGIRMLVVTNQTSLFYQFDIEIIKIISVFDNRMNPDKLANEMK